MPQLMRAADLIVCKAGGLTVTESLACGLPMLFTDVTPGQEEGNARYAIQHGAGEWAKNPTQALEILFHWLDRDHKQLDERARMATSLGQPRAAFTVADLAWKASGALEQLGSTSRLREWVPKLKELLRAFDISIEN
jgi:UDP-N-acetylglucosamine:LPS N-acetylglucosamine transferase